MAGIAPGARMIWLVPLLAFLFGAIGLAAQIVLFREALVRAGGDELVLGALLASWLVAGAVGAVLARWPRRGEVWLLLPGLAVLALGLVGGVLAWRGAEGLAGTLPGERQGALLFALQAFLWNGPTAVAAGWLFARLARGGARAPSLVGLEALGAALAGVLLALPAVIALLPSGEALDTRHGRIEVVTRGGEQWLSRDGRDAWLLEGETPRAGRRALAALLLQAPPGARVLMVGDPDFLPAVLEHEPAAVDLLLGDPALLPRLEESAGPRLAAALADPRVHARSGGLRRWLRSAPEPYAIVWLGDVDPIRAEASRSVSVEGLELARERLEEGGFLGLRLGGVDGVNGSLGMRRAALVAAGIAEVGVEPLLLSDGTLLGARPPTTWILEAPRLAAEAQRRALPAPFPLEAAWRDLLLPATLESWNRALRPGAEALDPLELLLTTDSVDPGGWPPFAPGPRHTDLRPRATALSALLAEEHARGGRPGWLEAVAVPGTGGLAVLALLLLLLGSRLAALGGPRGTTAAAFGLTTSSLAGTVGLLLVLEGYQAETGLLYADLGWIAATFLLGFAGGSRGHARLAGARADLAMIVVLALVGLLPLALLPSTASAAACALLLGVATGAPVGSAAATRGLGWAWALDLAAAAPGALLAGVVLLPVSGWFGSLLLLAGLKAAALLSRALGRPSRAPGP